MWIHLCTCILGARKAQIRPLDKGLKGTTMRAWLMQPRNQQRTCSAECAFLNWNRLFRAHWFWLPLVDWHNPRRWWFFFRTNGREANPTVKRSKSRGWRNLIYYFKLSVVLEKTHLLFKTVGYFGKKLAESSTQKCLCLIGTTVLK